MRNSGLVDYQGERKRERDFVGPCVIDQPMGMI
jgi:hypothetical protein